MVVKVEVCILVSVFETEAGTVRLGSNTCAGPVIVRLNVEKRARIGKTVARIAVSFKTVSAKPADVSQGLVV